jgi:hypothetical protein
VVTLIAVTLMDDHSASDIDDDAAYDRRPTSVTSGEPAARNR